MIKDLKRSGKFETNGNADFEELLFLESWTRQECVIYF